MSLANGAETAILALIFNATTWNNWAENDTTTPNTNTYLGLHTGDPGEAGNQTTNEAAYTDYARAAVARTSGGWTVSGNAATLTSQVSFTIAGGGTETETHMSVGGSLSGTGELVGSGTITPNISVSTGVTPILTTSTSVTLD